MLRPDHQVRVQHALGHRAQLERCRAERPELRPAGVTGPGTPRSPRWRGRGPRTPRGRWRVHPSRHRRPAPRRSGRRWPGCGRGRPGGPRRRARRCWSSRRARPDRHSSSRRPGRSPPAVRTARRRSPPTPRRARPARRRAAPAGRRRSAARSRRYWPGFLPLGPQLLRVRRARRGRRQPRRRAPPAGERRPRVTNPTVRRRPGSGESNRVHAPRPGRLPTLWLPLTSPGTSPT